MRGARRNALVALAAASGIALAAAITYGTSQLVSQHIGLASEPITAGRSLVAPASGSAPHRPRAIQGPAGAGATSAPTYSRPSTQVPAPTTAASAPAPSRSSGVSPTRAPATAPAPGTGGSNGTSSTQRSGEEIRTGTTQGASREGTGSGQGTNTGRESAGDGAGGPASSGQEGQERAGQGGDGRSHVDD